MGSKLKPVKSGGMNTDMPWLTALSILEKAHSHFKEKRGIGFGKLILMYQSGECKIIPTDQVTPNTSTYRVQIMGSGITVTNPD
jgi:hypothetical protein